MEMRVKVEVEGFQMIALNHNITATKLRVK